MPYNDVEIAKSLVILDVGDIFRKCSIVCLEIELHLVSWQNKEFFYESF